VRAELHRPRQASRRRDYDAAARLVPAAPSPGRPSASPKPWPLLGRAQTLLATPAARRPSLTRLDDIGPALARPANPPRPEGDEDWSLDCVVDLTDDRPEGRPLLDLQRIGV